MPGITAVPTPGHSPGHQSLLVENTGDGRVLLAGQAFDTASEFALAALACQLDGDQSDLSAPDWMATLRSADIDLALFAHDLAAVAATGGRLSRQPSGPAVRGVTVSSGRRSEPIPELTWSEDPGAERRDPLPQ